VGSKFRRLGWGEIADLELKVGPKVRIELKLRVKGVG
jgi:hypothetical protein